MDIIQSIDRFIKSRSYNYALLINGKWGSGKTYFVKQVLIPHLSLMENKPDVNYLSLYGIKSTDEISQMLCVQAIKDKAGKVGTLTETKIGQIATVLFSSMIKLGLAKIGTDYSEAESLLRRIPNFDNNVIIFDDLERCGCPINEVFGYINNFIEHSNASVILVANEDEIDREQLNQNLELQTIIAMDDRIKVELPLNEDDVIKGITMQEGKEQKRSKGPYTPEEVKYKRKAIFHNNEGYKSIKEKVIGLTINYKPDLKTIFKTLIENNVNDLVLRQELIDEIDWFVEIANKDNHQNLRTFQYYLEKISIIFETIQNEYPTLHKIILQYTYRSSIRYMKGLGMPAWDGDYGFQEFDVGKPFNNDQLFGFRFIDELIEHNYIESKYLSGVLGKYVRIKEMKGQLNDDPYGYIKKWWIYEDGKVSKWLDKIKENVKSGKYSTELYPELLRYLAELKAYNIKVEKCDSVLQAMQSYIQNADPDDLEELEKERFIVDSDTGKIYRSMCESVTTLIESKKSMSERQAYQSAVDDMNHWATNLLELLDYNGVLQGHSFIYWLDPQVILENIAISNNSELYQFRLALQAIYDSRIFYEHKGDDYNHLSELYEGFKTLDKSNWGEVKQAYGGWICNDIGRYLEKIKPVLTIQ